MTIESGESTGLNDEQELNEIFQPSGRLNAAIAAAKRRSFTRNLVISFAVVLVAIVGVAAIAGLFQKSTGAKQSVVESVLMRYYEVSGPDTYIGKLTRYKGLFHGKTLYSTYKLIQGRVVYDGDHECSYGTFGPGSLQGIESAGIISTSTNEEDARQQRYNLYGQREMLFYYPFLRYDSVRMDAAKLKDIGGHKYVEMALSFDKGYHIKQVQKMIPAGAAISWYWVNDVSRSQQAQMESSPAGLAPVRSENDVIGMKAFDADGNRFEHPEQFFLNSLVDGNNVASRVPSNSAQGSMMAQAIQNAYRNIIGGKNLSSVDLTVFGVVVTGTAQSLEALNRLPHVRASSFGVISEKY